MTKEEFQEKLNNVLDYDWETHQPKYAGDSAPLEDIIEIQKEYIESLENELQTYKTYKTKVKWFWS